MKKFICCLVVLLCLFGLYIGSKTLFFWINKEEGVIHGGEYITDNHFLVRSDVPEDGYRFDYFCAENDKPVIYIGVTKVTNKDNIVFLTVNGKEILEPQFCVRKVVKLFNGK